MIALSSVPIPCLNMIGNDASAESNTAKKRNHHEQIHISRGRFGRFSGCRRLQSCARCLSERPVTTIVLFPPGGGTDTGARWVAQELSKKWGQSVIDSEKAKYRKIITEKNISATE